MSEEFSEVTEGRGQVVKKASQKPQQLEHDMTTDDITNDEYDDDNGDDYS